MRARVTIADRQEYLRVIRKRLAEGLTIAQACEGMGIGVRAYRRMLKPAETAPHASLGQIQAVRSKMKNR